MAALRHKVSVVGKVLLKYFVMLTGYTSHTHPGKAYFWMDANNEEILKIVVLLTRQLLLQSSKTSKPLSGVFYNLEGLCI
jgi:hypothetical protein